MQNTYCYRQYDQNKS